MSGSNDRPIWKEPAVVVGLVLTALAVGYFWYSFSHNPVLGEPRSYPDKFAYLKYARPNEVGDALAGLAGSLALVWIIVTVWLQATELKEQRKELAAQSKATITMAETQKEQTKLLSAQTDLFEEQLRQLKSARYDSTVDELLVSCASYLSTHGAITRWQTSDGKSFGFSRLTNRDEDWSTQFAGNLREVAFNIANAIDAEKTRKLTVRPDMSNELASFEGAISDIRKLTNSVSEAQRLRLGRLGVLRLAFLMGRPSFNRIWLGGDEASEEEIEP